MDSAILADTPDKKRTEGRQVSETHTTNPVFPPGRYGHRREGRRRPVVPIIILVVVLAASVLVSVKLYQRYGQTDYQAQIVGWQQTDTTMTIKFTVQVPAGQPAECVLRARDYGGNEVGRRTVVVKPADRSATSIEADETVATTKRGYVGDVVGCQPAG